MPAAGCLSGPTLRNPKTFKQRRPDGKGWIWTLRDVKRVLYALPGLTKYPDATVFVTEGERDSDSLIALEQCATTVASGKWDGVDLEPLRGRECIVLQDNDDAGHKKALDAAKHLHGIAATVRIVLLPDLPDKGDVSDWLNAGHSVDDLIEVCFAAPLWEPIAGVAEQGADDNIEPAAISVAPDAASDRPPPALAPPPPPLPLPFISITAWHDQPIPEREWCVRDRVPMRNVTLFSGEGAIGKSIIVLQLSVAHVLGRIGLVACRSSGQCSLSPAKTMPVSFIVAYPAFSVITARASLISKTCI